MKRCSCIMLVFAPRSLMVDSPPSIVPEQTHSNQGPCSRLGRYPAQLVRAPDHARKGGTRPSLQRLPLAVTDELVWFACCGMLKSGLMSRKSDLGGSYLMREHKTWLFFLMKRGWLYVQGLLRFGPVRTQRGRKSVHMALDAFEHYSGRLPDTDERSRPTRSTSQASSGDASQRR